MPVGMATSIFTREELLEQIGEWKNALRACQAGRSYTIGSRQLTRYDLSEIWAQLDRLKAELDALDGNGGPHIVQARFFGRRARLRRPK